MANVKVAVRVRPLSKKEEESNATNIVEIKGDNGLSIKNIKVDSPESVGDKHRERVKYFNFDHCYYSVDKTQPNYASQELIFQDLGTEVLNSSFDGYNVSLFAYGQTGSGKTYTMMGNPHELGVIPRICEGLCSRVDDFEDGVTFKIEVSYLEIYNERVRDLLAAPDDVKYTLKVREHPKEGPYVQDLSRHFVTDYAMVTMLLNKGNINRTTAATHMHDASSRSHAIFTLHFIQAKIENGMPSEIVSKINLVDLAGSERAKYSYSKDRLLEGANINKSLVTLGNCISALAENSMRLTSSTSVESLVSEDGDATSSPRNASTATKKSAFIPYRNSILTWLLRDSLGGNAKTIMIATISPASCNFNESMSTLRYARRAKRIINNAIINEDPNVRLIRELRSEIDRLKTLLNCASLNSADKKDKLRHGEVKCASDYQYGADDASSSQNSLVHDGAISKMLQENEQRIDQLTEAWVDKWRAAARIMQECNVGIRRESVGVIVESELPHLIGMDDDLLSTGIILYHIKEGETKIGRSDAEVEQDIVLYGPGIDQQHASVENRFGNVTLSPINGALCAVNGMDIQEPTPLTQGAVILLGKTNMFRFNHPAEAAKLREKRAPRRRNSITLRVPNNLTALSDEVKRRCSLSLASDGSLLLDNDAAADAAANEELRNSSFSALQSDVSPIMMFNPGLELERQQKIEADKLDHTRKRLQELQEKHRQAEEAHEEKEKKMNEAYQEHQKMIQEQKEVLGKLTKDYKDAKTQAEYDMEEMRCKLQDEKEQGKSQLEEELKHLREDLSNKAQMAAKDSPNFPQVVARTRSDSIVGISQLDVDRKRLAQLELLQKQNEKKAMAALQRRIATYERQERETKCLIEQEEKRLHEIESIPSFEDRFDSAGDDNDVFEDGDNGEADGERAAVIGLGRVSPIGGRSDSDSSSCKGSLSGKNSMGSVSSKSNNGTVQGNTRPTYVKQQPKQTAPKDLRISRTDNRRNGVNESRGSRQGNRISRQENRTTPKQENKTHGRSPDKSHSRSKSTDIPKKGNRTTPNQENKTFGRSVSKTHCRSKSTETPKQENRTTPNQENKTFGRSASKMHSRSKSTDTLTPKARVARSQSPRVSSPSPRVSSPSPRVSSPSPRVSSPSPRKPLKSASRSPSPAKQPGGVFSRLYPQQKPKFDFLRSKRTPGGEEYDCSRDRARERPPELIRRDLSRSDSLSPINVESSRNSRATSPRRKVFTGDFEVSAEARMPKADLIRRPVSRSPQPPVSGTASYPRADLVHRPRSLSPRGPPKCTPELPNHSVPGKASMDSATVKPREPTSSIPPHVSGNPLKPVNSRSDGRARSQPNGRRESRTPDRSPQPTKKSKSPKPRASSAPCSPSTRRKWERPSKVPDLAKVDILFFARKTDNAEAFFVGLNPDKSVLPLPPSRPRSKTLPIQSTDVSDFDDQEQSPRTNTNPLGSDDPVPSEERPPAVGCSKSMEDMVNAKTMNPSLSPESSDVYDDDSLDGSLGSDIDDDSLDGEPVIKRPEEKPSAIHVVYPVNPSIQSEPCVDAINPLFNRNPVEGQIDPIPTHVQSESEESLPIAMEDNEPTKPQKPSVQQMEQPTDILPEAAQERIANMPHDYNEPKPEIKSVVQNLPPKEPDSKDLEDDEEQVSVHIVKDTFLEKTPLELESNSVVIDATIESHKETNLNHDDDGAPDEEPIIDGPDQCIIDRYLEHHPVDEMPVVDSPDHIIVDQYLEQHPIDKQPVIDGTDQNLDDQCLDHLPGDEKSVIDNPDKNIVDQKLENHPVSEKPVVDGPDQTVIDQYLEHHPGKPCESPVVDGPDQTVIDQYWEHHPVEPCENPVVPPVPCDTITKPMQDLELEKDPMISPDFTPGDEEGSKIKPVQEPEETTIILSATIESPDSYTISEVQEIKSRPDENNDKKPADEGVQMQLTARIESPDSWTITKVKEIKSRPEEALPAVVALIPKDEENGTEKLLASKDHSSLDEFEPLQPLSVDKPKKNTSLEPKNYPLFDEELKSRPKENVPANEDVHMQPPVQIESPDSRTLTKVKEIKSRPEEALAKVTVLIPNDKENSTEKPPESKDQCSLDEVQPLQPLRVDKPRENNDTKPAGEDVQMQPPAQIESPGSRTIIKVKEIKSRPEDVTSQVTSFIPKDEENSAEKLPESQDQCSLDAVQPLPPLSVDKPTKNTSLEPKDEPLLDEELKSRPKENIPANGDVQMPPSAQIESPDSQTITKVKEIKSRPEEALPEVTVLIQKDDENSNEKPPASKDQCSLDKVEPLQPLSENKTKKNTSLEPRDDPISDDELKSRPKENLDTKPADEGVHKQLPTQIESQDSRTITKVKEIKSRPEEASPEVMLFIPNDEENSAEKLTESKHTCYEPKDDPFLDVELKSRPKQNIDTKPAGEGVQMQLPTQIKSPDSRTTTKVKEIKSRPEEASPKVMALFPKENSAEKLPESKDTCYVDDGIFSQSSTDEIQEVQPVVDEKPKENTGIEPKDDHLDVPEDLLRRDSKSTSDANRESGIVLTSSGEDWSDTESSDGSGDSCGDYTVRRIDGLPEPLEVLEEETYLPSEFSDENSSDAPKSPEKLAAELRRNMIPDGSDNGAIVSEPRPNFQLYQLNIQNNITVPKMEEMNKDNAILDDLRQLHKKLEDSLTESPTRIIKNAPIDIILPKNPDLENGKDLQSSNMEVNNMQQDSLSPPSQLQMTSSEESLDYHSAEENVTLYETAYEDKSLNVSSYPVSLLNLSVEAQAHSTPVKPTDETKVDIVDKMVEYLPKYSDDVMDGSDKIETIPEFNSSLELPIESEAVIVDFPDFKITLDSIREETEVEVEEDEHPEKEQMAKMAEYIDDNARIASELKQLQDDVNQMSSMIHRYVIPVTLSGSLNTTTLSSSDASNHARLLTFGSPYSVAAAQLSPIPEEFNTHGATTPPPPVKLNSLESGERLSIVIDSGSRSESDEDQEDESSMQRHQLAHSVGSYEDEENSLFIPRPSTSVPQLRAEKQPNFQQWQQAESVVVREELKPFLGRDFVATKAKMNLLLQVITGRSGDDTSPEGESPPLRPTMPERDASPEVLLSSSDNEDFTVNELSVSLPVHLASYTDEPLISKQAVMLEERPIKWPEIPDSGEPEVDRTTMTSTLNHKIKEIIVPFPDEPNCSLEFPDEPEGLFETWLSDRPVMEPPINRMAVMLEETPIRWPDWGDDEDADAQINGDEDADAQTDDEITDILSEEQHQVHKLNSSDIGTNTSPQTLSPPPYSRKLTCDAAAMTVPSKEAGLQTDDEITEHNLNSSANIGTNTSPLTIPSEEPGLQTDDEITEHNLNSSANVGTNTSPPTILSEEAGLQTDDEITDILSNKQNNLRNLNSSDIATNTSPQTLSPPLNPEKLTCDAASMTLPSEEAGLQTNDEITEHSSANIGTNTSPLTIPSEEAGLQTDDEITDILSNKQNNVRKLNSSAHIGTNTSPQTIPSEEAGLQTDDEITDILSNKQNNVHNLNRSAHIGTNTSPQTIPSEEAGLQSDDEVTDILPNKQHCVHNLNIGTNTSPPTMSPLLDTDHHTCDTAVMTLPSDLHSDNDFVLDDVHTDKEITDFMSNEPHSVQSSYGSDIMVNAGINTSPQTLSALLRSGQFKHDAGVMTKPSDLHSDSDFDLDEGMPLPVRNTCTQITPTAELEGINSSPQNVSLLLNADLPRYDAAVATISSLHSDDFIFEEEMPLPVRSTSTQVTPTAELEGINASPQNVSPLLNADLPRCDAAVATLSSLHSDDFVLEEEMPMRSTSTQITPTAELEGIKTSPHNVSPLLNTDRIKCDAAVMTIPSDLHSDYDFVLEDETALTMRSISTQVTPTTELEELDAMEPILFRTYGSLILEHSEDDEIESNQDTNDFIEEKLMVNRSTSPIKLDHMHPADLSPKPRSPKRTRRVYLTDIKTPGYYGASSSSCTEDDQTEITELDGDEIALLEKLKLKKQAAEEATRRARDYANQFKERNQSESLSSSEDESDLDSSIGDNDYVNEGDIDESDSEDINEVVALHSDDEKVFHPKVTEVVNKELKIPEECSVKLANKLANLESRGDDQMNKKLAKPRFGNVDVSPTASDKSDITVVERKRSKSAPKDPSNLMSSPVRSSNVKSSRTMPEKGTKLANKLSNLESDSDNQMNKNLAKPRFGNVDVSPTASDKSDVTVVERKRSKPAPKDPSNLTSSPVRSSNVKSSRTVPEKGAKLLPIISEGSPKQRQCLPTFSDISSFDSDYAEDEDFQALKASGERIDKLMEEIPSFEEGDDYYPDTTEPELLALVDDGKGNITPTPRHVPISAPAQLSLAKYKTSEMQSEQPQLDKSKDEDLDDLRLQLSPLSPVKAGWITGESDDDDDVPSRQRSMVTKPNGNQPILSLSSGIFTASRPLTSSLGSTGGSEEQDFDDIHSAYQELLQAPDSHLDGRLSHLSPMNACTQTDMAETESVASQPISVATHDMSSETERDMSWKSPELESLRDDKEFVCSKIGNAIDRRDVSVELMEAQMMHGMGETDAFLRFLDSDLPVEEWFRQRRESLEKQKSIMVTNVVKKQEVSTANDNRKVLASQQRRLSLRSNQQITPPETIHSSSVSPRVFKTSADLELSPVRPSTQPVASSSSQPTPSQYRKFLQNLRQGIVSATATPGSEGRNDLQNLLEESQVMRANSKAEIARAKMDLNYHASHNGVGGGWDDGDNKDGPTSGRSQSAPAESQMTRPAKSCNGTRRLNAETEDAVDREIECLRAASAALSSSSSSLADNCYEEQPGHRSMSADTWKGRDNDKNNRSQEAAQTRSKSALSSQSSSPSHKQMPVSSPPEQAKTPLPLSFHYTYNRYPYNKFRRSSISKSHSSSGSPALSSPSRSKTTTPRTDTDDKSDSSPTRRPESPQKYSSSTSSSNEASPVSTGKKQAVARRPVPQHNNEKSDGDEQVGMNSQTPPSTESQRKRLSGSSSRESSPDRKHRSTPSSHESPNRYSTSPLSSGRSSSVDVEKNHHTSPAVSPQMRRRNRTRSNERLTPELAPLQETLANTSTSDLDYTGEQAVATLFTEMIQVGGFNPSKHQHPKEYGGWRLQGQENGILLLQKTRENNPIDSFMGISIIKAPVRTVFGLIRDVSNLKSIDSNLQEVQVLDDFPNRFKILHLIYTTDKCYLQKSRDVCVLLKDAKQLNKYVISATSVQHRSCPVVEGVVRARVMCCGIGLEPINTPTGEHCKVMYRSQVDLKGELQPKLTNVIMKKQPLCIENIKKFVENCKK